MTRHADTCRGDCHRCHRLIEAAEDARMFGDPGEDAGMDDRADYEMRER